MEVYIAVLAGSASYHLWQIRKLMPYLSPQDLATMHAMVTSWLALCRLTFEDDPESTASVNCGDTPADLITPVWHAFSWYYANFTGY